MWVGRAGALLRRRAGALLRICQWRAGEFIGLWFNSAPARRWSLILAWPSEDLEPARTLVSIAARDLFEKTRFLEFLEGATDLPDAESCHVRDLLSRL